MTIYKALNIKAFMNALLKNDVFDKFELIHLMSYVSKLLDCLIYYTF